MVSRTLTMMLETKGGHQNPPFILPHPQLSSALVKSCQLTKSGHFVSCGLWWEIFQPDISRLKIYQKK